MPDGVPAGEEPHVWMLEQGLRLSRSMKFRAKLAAARKARRAGTPVADENELIKAVEKLIDRNPL